MIELYSGTPGSGKSLHVAKEIRDRLQMRRKPIIIGNFYVNTKEIKKCFGTYIYVDNSRLTPERLILFSKRLAKHYGRRVKEEELLIVIDEAQLIFNSRDWQCSRNKGWMSFFTQHRKYGYNVILITQFDRLLDRQVRSLLEYETIHRKVSRAGKMGAVVGFFTGGNMFVAIKRWYPLHEKVSSQFFMGNKRIYTIYDSYNQFDIAKA